MPVRHPILWGRRRRREDVEVAFNIMGEEEEGNI